LGQNFLIDPNLQRKIVAALSLRSEDEVLEIGPGRGALTAHIAGKCRSLILVELDRELATELEGAYGSLPGVRVIQGDILEHHPASLTSNVSDLKVLGNIPYNITSPILFFLLRRPRPRDILLMVQREVGDRILASPGTSAYGALTVGVRSVAHVDRVLRAPAGAFRPRPAVESVVVRITPERPAPLEVPEERALRLLTRLAFQQRRKQFQTILRNHPETSLSAEQVREVETATGFDLRRRPETFSPWDFVLISRVLTGMGRL
jgi:16S rRNA (adenine1518-N6/adenine1519-N6)-dimethyltransferase